MCVCVATCIVYDRVRTVYVQYTQHGSRAHFIISSVPAAPCGVRPAGSRRPRTYTPPARPVFPLSSLSFLRVKCIQINCAKMEGTFDCRETMIPSALTRSHSHQSTLPRVELGTEDQGVSVVVCCLAPRWGPRCHHGTPRWTRSGMSPPVGAFREGFPLTGGASFSYATARPSRRAG